LSSHLSNRQNNNQNSYLTLVFSSQPSTLLFGKPPHKICQHPRRPCCPRRSSTCFSPTDPSGSGSGAVSAENELYIGLSIPRSVTPVTFCLLLCCWSCETSWMYKALADVLPWSHLQRNRQEKLLLPIVSLYSHVWTHQRSNCSHKFARSSPSAVGAEAKHEKVQYAAETTHCMFFLPNCTFQATTLKT
jgi:hypothetical protein